MSIVDYYRDVFYHTCAKLYVNRLSTELYVVRYVTYDWEGYPQYHEYEYTDCSEARAHADELDKATTAHVVWIERRH